VWPGAAASAKRDEQAAWISGSGADLDCSVERQSRHRHVGERAAERQEPRIVIEHGFDSRRGIHVQAPRFAQQNKAEGMIDLGVGQQDTLNRHVADCGWCRMTGQPRELIANVRGGVQEKPLAAVRADSRRRLKPWPRRLRIRTRSTATPTPTVPLREAAARGGTDQEDVHTKGEWRNSASIEFRPDGLATRRVRGHFKGYFEVFELWFRPGHV
jgi:hypothetical protein